MAAALKRREPLPSLLSTPPGTTARDDTSTAKQELEKCYKRIADLETRIHDLTLQNSVVSYLLIVIIITRGWYLVFGGAVN